MMRWFQVLLFCGILPSFSSASQLDESSARNIVLAALEKRGLSLQIVTKDEFEVSEYCVSDAREEPALVIGDFTGDGREDICALLREEWTKRTVRSSWWRFWARGEDYVVYDAQLRVVLFSAQENAEWMMKEIFSTKRSYRIDVVLWRTSAKILAKQAPLEYNDADVVARALEVRDSCPRTLITIDFCEKAWGVFFWDADKQEYVLVWYSG